jgi:glycosyltransferase involved in cell wall biosynthesis
MNPHPLRLISSALNVGQAPREPNSIVLIGSYPPRRCGIATFTHDVYQCLIEARPELRCEVFAMTDGDGPYEYPPEVAFELSEQHPVDYRNAAARVCRTQPDVILVQHEFGIFGGSAGEHLMLLLEAVDTPVVSLLHTVLDRPNSDQRRVFERLIGRSDQLIVMAEHGRVILRETWKVPDDRITVIPHGAPDRPLHANEPFKEKLGLQDRDLLFSFGLISPNKGLESVIRALPAIVAARPNVIYDVLGATHPHLIAREGERYRMSLIELASELGVDEHLRLIDEYVDTPRLIEYLQAADVYLSPYPNPAQITSGTLSYAAALGIPIVATPYWHAKELLGDGGGRLVPFRDSDAIAQAVTELLEQPEMRTSLRESVYGKARSTVWSCFAESSLAVLAKAQPQRPPLAATHTPPLPSPILDGVRRLTDNCGILQHSLYNIPDRRHGYCVDDNARALLLMNRLPGPPTDERRSLTDIYAAFVQHAWNGEAGRFRNFMSYERAWLEEAGSEDSTGRSFWSIAETATQSTEPSLRRWASALTHQVMPYLHGLRAVRANAFVLLGLSELVEAGFAGDSETELAKTKLAMFKRLLADREAEGDPWFEPWVSYDNARLPEAMIRAGVALADSEAIDAGLRALKWLCTRQTSEEGHFLPVATCDIGLPHDRRTFFDQQPVEAAATIDACDAAYLVTHDKSWAQECDRAYAWYFGGNILGVRMAQPGGECFDGLTWRGPNENMGAESVLALQLATCARARVVANGLETIKTAAKPLS